LADGKSIAETLMGDPEAQKLLLEQYMAMNPNASPEEMMAWLNSDNAVLPSFTPENMMQLWGQDYKDGYGTVLNEDGSYMTYEAWDDAVSTKIREDFANMQAANPEAFKDAFETWLRGQEGFEDVELTDENFDEYYGKYG
jgi:hypothetical protein